MSQTLNSETKISMILKAVIVIGLCVVIPGAIYDDVKGDVKRLFEEKFDFDLSIDRRFDRVAEVSEENWILIDKGLDIDRSFFAELLNLPKSLDSKICLYQETYLAEDENSKINVSGAFLARNEDDSIEMIVVPNEKEECMSGSIVAIHKRFNLPIVEYNEAFVEAFEKGGEMTIGAKNYDIDDVRIEDGHLKFEPKISEPFKWGANEELIIFINELPLTQKLIVFQYPTFLSNFTLLVIIFSGWWALVIAFVKSGWRIFGFMIDPLVYIFKGK